MSKPQVEHVTIFFQTPFCQCFLVQTIWKKGLWNSQTLRKIWPNYPPTPHYTKCGGFGNRQGQVSSSQWRVLPRAIRVLAVRSLNHRTRFGCAATRASTSASSFWSPTMICFHIPRTGCPQRSVQPSLAEMRWNAFTRPNPHVLKLPKMWPGGPVVPHELQVRRVVAAATLTLQCWHICKI